MDKPLVLDNSEIPIRLFKSDFLEFFTHVHPITIIIIWVPFSFYMLEWGVNARPAGSDNRRCSAYYCRRRLVLDYLAQGGVSRRRGHAGHRHYDFPRSCRRRGRTAGHPAARKSAQWNSECHQPPVQNDIRTVGASVDLRGRHG